MVPWVVGTCVNVEAGGECQQRPLGLCPLKDESGGRSLLDPAVITSEALPGFPYL